MTDNDGREAGLELALNLMASSVAQTHRTTNTLLDNLREEAVEYRVTLEYIRQEVAELLSGRYMPNPNAIFSTVMCPDYNITRAAAAMLVGFGHSDQDVETAVAAARCGKTVEFVQ